MNTRTKLYWHKLLTYSKDNIQSVKKMQIARSKAVALIATIILAGTICLHPAISSLLGSYTIQSSGSIRYGPMQTPSLHTEGKYIKDEDGNIVFLRGAWKAEYLDTSTGWWTSKGVNPGSDPNYYQWNEGALREQMEVMSKPIPVYDGTLQDLVNKINTGQGGWGMNYFCTLFWGDWWLTNARNSVAGGAGSTDIGLRDSIKETLRIAQEYGLYFQIRLYSPTQAEGRVMFPYDTGEAYCSKVWQQQDFVNFWVNVATELKDYPNIILCLFDEPVTNYPDTPDPVSGKSWFDTVIETVDAMRGVGFNGLIMLQWGFCGDNYWMENFYNYLNNKGRLDILNNLVFSNHFYRYHGTFDYIGQSTDYNTMKDYIYRDNVYPYYPIVGLHYNRTINELQLPVIVSGGAFNGAVDNDEYMCVKNWLLILNELEAGYSVYQYHRSELAWAIQQPTVAIQPPNRVGQALIDAIAAATG